MTATYAEVKDLQNHPEIILIDVREPKELIDDGKIPTSINIPLTQVEEALKLNIDDFQKKYGHLKPDFDAPIIFHCKAGGRAQKALEVAKTLGYTNLKNYKGSWLDWASKEGLQ